VKKKTKKAKAKYLIVMDNGMTIEAVDYGGFLRGLLWVRRSKDTDKSELVKIGIAHVMFIENIDSPLFVEKS
jgi:hypothetical protein